MKSVYGIAIAVCLASFSWTVHAEDYSKYIREPGGLGSGADKSIATPEQYTPRYTDNPPNTDAYYGGGLQIPTTFGNQKLADCENIAENDLYKRQECEGVNLVTKGVTQRPDVNLTEGEKLIDHTRNISEEPAATLDKYKWVYKLNPDGSIGEIPAELCKEEPKEITTIKKEETCFQYSGAEAFLCESKLKVTVDPNFNYSCLETKYQNSTEKCSKKLSMRCEASPNCTTKGVQAGTPEGDMQVSLSKLNEQGLHQLTFGGKGDNYWNYNALTGKQIDRQLVLNIVGKERLEVFKMTRVEYDDWLLVTVNGNVVYSSAGAKIRFKLINDPTTRMGTVVREDNPSIILGRPERKTSWKRNPNVDIRPYLKEGQNIINARVIYGGGGEAAMLFQTHMFCEPNCTETWDDQCREYEERTK